MRRRAILRCGVAAAFRPVGMDVYALDDSRAAAIAPGRVKSFKDFCVTRGEGVPQPAGGKVPPGQ
jgi:hypothetical protein